MPESKLHKDLVALQTMSRRDTLRFLTAAGLATLVGCNAGTTDSTDTATSSENEDATCSLIPSETAGPYPGDGSNGVNALTKAGIVRSDITQSFGDASGTATGIPLTVKLTVLDKGNSCVPLSDFAVYMWHCDQNGNYSLYSTAIKNENYLRGVQETDSEGVVTFKTIFPGCYSGRWPHIHFEVYPSLDLAVSQDNIVKISQLALPENICKEVYATSGYSSSLTNLGKITLASDNIFSDGSTLQLATVTGSTSEGYLATLTFAPT